VAETIFSYRAFDLAGELRTGVIAAEDVDEVAERIRRMGLRPINVERKRGGSLNKSIRLPGREKAVKAGDLAVFNRQLATMISSGLPMMRCLSALQQQAGHPTILKAITAIREDVQNGDSLSAAVARHPRTFDQFYVSMIEAGEATGNLDAALFQLADALERSSAIRRKVKSAMTYPVAIAGLATLIVVAMLVFLVPTFEKIFADLDGQLPLPTRIVIGASRFLTGNVLLVLLLVVLTVVGLRLAVRTERGRFAWDSAKLRIPVLGPLLLRGAIARFARSLAVLLRSGTMILDALDIASRTVPNAVIRKAVTAMEQDVRNGRSIGACMAEQPIFPSMVVQMVEVGEESGRLDSLLEKVADYYENRVQASVDAITSLIEPALLIFMGFTVGGMVISLYLPMFQVINLVQ
jgi:type IV pilus assembly protein PilC